MKAKLPDFGHAHMEFPRALRSLSYAYEKCSGVENGKIGTKTIGLKFLVKCAFTSFRWVFATRKKEVGFFVNPPSFALFFCVRNWAQPP